MTSKLFCTDSPVVPEIQQGQKYNVIEEKRYVYSLIFRYHLDYYLVEFRIEETVNCHQSLTQGVSETTPFPRSFPPTIFALECAAVSAKNCAIRFSPVGRTSGRYPAELLLGAVAVSAKMTRDVLQFLAGAAGEGNAAAN